jgi:hypothetical protein
VEYFISRIQLYYFGVISVSLLLFKYGLNFRNIIFFQKKSWKYSLLWTDGVVICTHAGLYYSNASTHWVQDMEELLVMWSHTTRPWACGACAQTKPRKRITFAEASVFAVHAVLALCNATCRAPPPITFAIERLSKNLGPMAINLVYICMSPGIILLKHLASSHPPHPPLLLCTNY